MNLANSYNLAGISETKEVTRTFAYPWLLSLFVKFSRFVNLPFGFLLFAFQIFAYYAAALLAAGLAARQCRRLSAGVYLALCLNIFVIPYTGVVLTDSLYTSLSLVILVLILSAESLKKDEKLPNSWIFLLFFCFSLALAIRPAALWLIIPGAFSLGKAILKKQAAIEDVLWAGLFGCIPLYIQMALNTHHYGIPSVLPVRNLGDEQIKWGIENIKYGTWLGGGALQNFYPTTELIKGASGELNIHWYLKNVLTSIRLLSVKLIGAFDFDFLMPYPYRIPSNTFTRWAPSFIAFTILWTGIFAIAFHALSKKLTLLGSRFMPALIFIAWAMFTLPTAIELRFTLPIIPFLIVSAGALVYYLAHNRDRKVLFLLLGGWLITMPLFLMCAQFIRAQSVLN